MRRASQALFEDFLWAWESNFRVSPPCTERKQSGDLRNSVRYIAQSMLMIPQCSSPTMHPRKQTSRRSGEFWMLTLRRALSSGRHAKMLLGVTVLAFESVLSGLRSKGVDEHGQVVVRVLHDGTREVSINSRIQVRDQDAGPLAQDLKRVLREQSEVSDQVAGLVVDVKGAHRLVPVREEDWGLQACSLTSDGPVYLNRVGTFGFSSASYWWSRAGGAWVRLAHYVIGGRAPSWLLLVADDLNQSASGPHQVTALMVVLVLAAIVDIPISWHKVKGGQALSWVGYEILLAEHKAGISASRAAWAVRWCREQLESERVLVSRFEEGVGRLSFVAGILDWDRAFLSPLYKFLAPGGPRRDDHAPAIREAISCVPLRIFACPSACLVPSTFSSASEFFAGRCSCFGGRRRHRSVASFRGREWSDLDCSFALALSRGNTVERTLGF